MTKTLRLLSRASELAVIQARLVGEALTERWPDLSVSYVTRASAGDRDRSVPLADAGDKGLFTQDLSDALARGHADMVVHSWKDLPIAPREDTVVAGTLPRADPRDVLLLRRDAIDARPATLVILTSSPRRQWQLTSSVRSLLPWPVDQVETHPIRGNIPTRLDKLHRHDGHGLVVAKAALDRLLDPAAPPETRNRVRTSLEACRWMVLPIQEFPTAPAQGALAIEVSRHNADARRLAETISHEATFRACTTERRILEAHGGGCHEALGATVLTKEFGSIVSVRGRLPTGMTISRWELDASQPLPPPTDERSVFPRPGERAVSEREPIAADVDLDNDDLWVSRTEALPAHVRPGPHQIVWAAGSRTWRKLARRGIWVGGCADGLGDEEHPAVDLLAGRETHWRRLTHTKTSDPSAIATYRVTTPLPDDLGSRTHFFWTSGTTFREALMRYPSIRSGWHASGPGRTASAIRDELGSTKRVSIWLDFDAWIQQVLG